MLFYCPISVTWRQAWCQEGESCVTCNLGVAYKQLGWVSYIVPLTNVTLLVFVQDSTVVFKSHIRYCTSYSSILHINQDYTFFEGTPIFAFFGYHIPFCRFTIRTQHFCYFVLQSMSHKDEYMLGGWVVILCHLQLLYRSTNVHMPTFGVNYC